MFRKMLGFSRYLFYKLKNMLFLNRNITFNNRILLPSSLNFEVHKNSEVELGKIIFNKNVSIRVRESAKLIIGTGVNFNNGCIITCRKHVNIGNNVLFGPNVMVFDHDHDYLAKDYTNTFKLGQIIIEDNVWIGANVIILKDTIIKKNSVIAAGTVVRGTVQENSIVYNRREIIQKKKQ
ncbi:acyltransferase [Paenibacillus graminis]|uniref:acyltransferase n=1 Tax=Paenibacillus graminis TaxID=189425 RepID=UPI002DBCFD2A|nr:acyltransferase [Paenibacillus graminis]MEC0169774.1 acyltransferase [Paenibacillus graminis]